MKYKLPFKSWVQLTEYVFLIGSLSVSEPFCVSRLPLGRNCNTIQNAVSFV